MLAASNPDRIDIAFDDDRLVDHAGLLLPATLAGRLGLRALADAHLDLGDAPGRANTGDKLLTLVASALAGGDCIADADALRAGGTASVLACTVKASSTLGTFLRSFRWGHVRQLDRVTRKLLARAWAAGAGPGAAPFTIDLDSTTCETYGLAKEGARHHGYTGAPGYHPLLAVAAGTGDVLMARLREGRANTARGAAHFLRETVARVARRRSERAADDARRQRLLQPRGRRRRLPRAGCPLLGHDPPAAERECADADRGDRDPGSGLDADHGYTGAPGYHPLLAVPVLAARAAAPLSPRRPTRRSGTRRTPEAIPRCGSSCGASSRRPAHSSRSSWTIATTPSSPTARGRRWSWRPTIAVTPRSRTRSVTSSTASG